VYERQTLNQLSMHYKKSKNWIRTRIAHSSIVQQIPTPQPIVAIADVTFFKRNFAILVIRAPHMKKNISVPEVHRESIDVYRQGRIALEKKGYTVQAIVLDGRPGVRQLFADIPVQMCHFHQKQIMTRYLTNNPKLETGIELKKITITLCEINEGDFTSALDVWYVT
jgi:hypothetical protein